MRNKEWISTKGGEIPFLYRRPAGAFLIFRRGGPMWPPANQNLRGMFGNSGASYLVEAPASSIEQSGSDKVQTLFKRFPCRLGLPAKQRNSPGSGPAGPENFGYFPSLESSPPAGGTSPRHPQTAKRHLRPTVSLKEENIL